MIRDPLLKAEAQLPANIKYSGKIESWGIENVDNKRTVIYTITVMASNMESWSVRRRYSEFRDNYLTVAAAFPRSKVAKFRFPNRTVFSSLSKANERKEQLQVYLNTLLEIHPPPIETIYFLRITRKALGLSTFGEGSIRSFSEPGKQISIE